MEAAAISTKRRNQSYVRRLMGTLPNPVCVFLFASIVGFLAINILEGEWGSGGPDHSVVARAMSKGPLKTSIELYRLHNGVYPPTLDALVVNPSAGATNWRGPYISAPALDPWHNAYQYVAPGLHNPATFDVYSMGPDGRAGTADDIGNWPVPTPNGQTTK